MHEIEQVIADMKRDGGAAHPCTRQVGGGHMQYLGLSVRDYFAAAALQGLLAAMKTTADTSEEQMAADFAGVAYVCADAMLKARAAEPKKEGE